MAAALGETVGLERLVPMIHAGGACVRFLVAPPGELREVHGRRGGLASCRAACSGCASTASRATVFQALHRASDRAGAVLASGDTREAALAGAAAAAARIRFVTEPVGAVV